MTCCTWRLNGRRNGFDERSRLDIHAIEDFVVSATIEAIKPDIPCLH